MQYSYFQRQYILQNADRFLLTTSVIVSWKMAKNFDIFPVDFIISECQDTTGKTDYWKLKLQALMLCRGEHDAVVFLCY